MPAQPAPAATPFPRMPSLRPAWARPRAVLLTVGAAFMAYLVLISVVLVLTILVLALVPGVNVALGVTSGDPTSPLDTALALAMGTMWLPAGIIGVRFGGWRPVGTAWSVAGRLRAELRVRYGLWGAAAALIALAAAVGAAGAVGAGPGTGSGAADGAPAGQLVLVALLLVVLVPLQAAGLELVLRGVVMQAVGSVVRGPVLPVLAAGAVMLIGRDLTTAVLVPAVTLGLCAAVLAWKSGGLELPLALTATATLTAHLTSALCAGTAAGAGAAALQAAAAAPGTSAAALAAQLDAAGAEAALAGGLAAAGALLLVTAALVVLISRREGLALAEPVTRAATEPVPAAIPH